MGLPCVATDVGDARVLLGDAGIIVPKEDAAALAAGVEKLLALTTDERKLLGQVANKRIHDKFSLTHAIERFEAIYKKVLNRNID